jgi:hypothetical protein
MRLMTDMYARIPPAMQEPFPDSTDYWMKNQSEHVDDITESYGQGRAQEEKGYYDLAQDAAKEGKTIVKVMYLYRNAGDAGHGDMAVVYEDGSATIYSYGAEKTQTGDMMGMKNVVGVSTKAELDPSTFSKFMTQGQVKSGYVPAKDLRYRPAIWEDSDTVAFNEARKYTGYVTMDIDPIGGQKVLARGESIVNQPELYNLSYNNCQYAAMQGLSAGGERYSFMPTVGEKYDNLIQFIASPNTWDRGGLPMHDWYNRAIPFAQRNNYQWGYFR